MNKQELIEQTLEIECERCLALRKQLDTTDKNIRQLRRINRENRLKLAGFEEVSEDQRQKNMVDFELQRTNQERNKKE